MRLSQDVFYFQIHPRILNTITLSVHVLRQHHEQDELCGDIHQIMILDLLPSKETLGYARHHQNPLPFGHK